MIARNEALAGRRWRFGVILLALLVPAWIPLLRPGLWAAHDMFHHLFRVVDLDIVLRGGTLYARWLPDLGFFYGYPVLNFYAPLTYYLTVLWRWLGAGYMLALKVSYALSFLVAAAGAYAWARRVWSPWAALWVAVAYTYVPYHLANAYVRGALAEHWAQALAPWLFLWVERLGQPVPPRGGRSVFALLVGGVVLTHNLSAVLLVPAAVGYGLLRLAGEGRLTRQTLAAWAGRVGGGIALAAGLSAVYWWPALAEVRWIRAGQVVSQVVDHVRQLASPAALVSPYWLYRYYPHQGVPFEHPLSRWQVGMVLLALVVVGWRWPRWRRAQRAWLLATGLLLLLGVGLMSSAAALVWRTVSFLAFLQFPWRWHVVVALMSAAWAAPLATVFEDWRLGRGRAWGPATAAFLLLWVGTSMPYLPNERLTWPGETPRPVEESDLTFWGMAQYDFLNGLWAREYGDPWLMEYLPVTVRLPRETFWLPGEPPVASYVPPDSVRVVRRCPTAFDLEVRAREATFLRWHQFWFPGWQATVDGRPVAVTPSPRLGVITVPIPAGAHRVRVWFGGTFPRVWGGRVSLLALGVILAGLWRGGQRRVLLAFVAVGGLWLLLWVGQNRWASTCDVPQADWKIVGDRVAYLGCATSSHVIPDDRSAVITLYWMALAPVPEDWKAFVHLLDPQGRTLAQHDAYPGENFSPTTRWEVGEIVPDVHTVRLPAPSSGWDRVRVGMYRFTDTIENLAWRGPNGENVGTTYEVRCANPRAQ